jgi:hypothetical protein
VTSTALQIRTGEFQVDASRVERTFARYPRLTWFHLRDTIGGIMGSHRREWLQRTRVDFSTRNGMRAGNLTSRAAGSAGFARQRTFFYRIEPQSRRPGPRATLDEIRAETFTESRVALGLEQGGTFRPKRSRWIAIPIGVTLDSLGRPKSRWHTPQSYLRASARNKLISLRLGTRNPIVYQVKGGGSRAAARQSGAITALRDRPTGNRRRARRILLPAYQLVRSVTRKPLLRYLETWEELASDRDRRFARMFDRIQEDVDRGKQA